MGQGQVGHYTARDPFPTNTPSCPPDRLLRAALLLRRVPGPLHVVSDRATIYLSICPPLAPKLRVPNCSNLGLLLGMRAAAAKRVSATGWCCGRPCRPCSVRSGHWAARASGWPSAGGAGRGRASQAGKQPFPHVGIAVSGPGEACTACTGVLGVPAGRGRPQLEYCCVTPSLNPQERLLHPRNAQLWAQPQKDLGPRFWGMGPTPIRPQLSVQTGAFGGEQHMGGSGLGSSALLSWGSSGPPLQPGTLPGPALRLFRKLIPSLGRGGEQGGRKEKTERWRASEGRGGEGETGGKGELLLLARWTGLWGCKVFVEGG